MDFAPEWVKILAGVIAAIAAGLYGGKKLNEREHRQQSLDVDADIGVASAQALVKRAEDRMRELHELREESHKILGGFDSRLVGVERDVKHIESTLAKVVASSETNNKLLTSILVRVSALGGRRAGDLATDPPDGSGLV